MGGRLKKGKTARRFRLCLQKVFDRVCVNQVPIQTTVCPEANTALCPIQGIVAADVDTANQSHFVLGEVAKVDGLGTSYRYAGSSVCRWQVVVDVDRLAEQANRLLAYYISVGGENRNGVSIADLQGAQVAHDGV